MSNNHKKQRLVYILGLPHGGSTFLSLLLASNPKCLALGEVSRWLNRGVFYENYENEKEPCSCGAVPGQCAFWRNYKEFHQKNRKESSGFKYGRLFELAREKYGDDIAIVDASKGLPALKEIAQFSNIDLRVIFLIKDLRNLTLSNRIKQERTGKKKRTTPYNILAWYKKNRQFKRFLEKNNINFFQAGYEEICLYPEYILPKLCEFMGVAYSEDMAKPAENDRAHYILGNKMRYQKEKKQRIFYDNRWFADWPVNFFLALFYPIFKWNRDNVYKNTKDYLWKL